MFLILILSLQHYDRSNDKYRKNIFASLFKIMQIFLQFLSNIYIKKLPDSTKRLGKRIRKLTHLNYSENGINRIKIVIRKILEENKTIKIDKIKNLKEKNGNCNAGRKNKDNYKIK